MRESNCWMGKLVFGEQSGHLQDNLDPAGHHNSSAADHNFRVEMGLAAYFTIRLQPT